MEYVSVPYTEVFAQTVAALDDPGAFLVGNGLDGSLNAMVIGWGLIGTIWSKPIFTVLVRPSRFTYGLLNETGSFTVCLASPAMRPAVDFCGSRSGRSHDKFREIGLIPLPSTRVAAPGISGSPLIYECQTVHTNDLIAEHVVPEIAARFYGSGDGDYHRVYFGEIMAVRRLVEGEEDA